MNTHDTTSKISRVMRRGLVVCPAVLVFHGALVVGPAWSEPRRWSDDFETYATYNSTALFAPCYGGGSTKYTVMEIFVGDWNGRVLSGGGKLVFTNTDNDAGGLPRREEPVFIGVLNIDQGCPDVAGVPYYDSTESFTSEDICIYGGVSFTPWHLRVWDDPDKVNDPFGPDGQPGIANVDDDTDGATDEDDEALALRPTTVNAGYGNRDGTGFPAGQDEAPGVVDVDDDGNGVTDDLGETGWAGSDDGDDTPGFIVWEVFMKGHIDDYERVLLQITPTNGKGKTAGDDCTIQHPFGLGATEFPLYYQATLLDEGDEATLGYLAEDRVYNYVFCGSGTCYGAMIWTEADMANPDETLGPARNTYCESSNGLVGFRNGLTNFEPAEEGAELKGVISRGHVWRGNSNFSDTFWVISGDARTFFPPIIADFDDDNDVDGQDFMKFSKCFNGSLRPPKDTCENPEADFDGDGDVDGQDFMAFSKCFNGSLRRPKCLPPILTICDGGEGGGDGGGGEEWPTIRDGESPEIDVIYVYTPTCTGAASFALCPTQEAELPDEEILLAFFDGVDIALLDCMAGDDCVECQSLDEEAVTLTKGKDVYLLFFAQEPIEGLDNLTLDVTCQ